MKDQQLPRSQPGAEHGAWSVVNVPTWLTAAGRWWLASNIRAQQWSALRNVELHQGQFTPPGTHLGILNYHVQYLAQLMLKSIWHLSQVGYVHYSTWDPRKWYFKNPHSLLNCISFLCSQFIWTRLVEDVAWQWLKLQHSRRSFTALAFPCVYENSILLIEMQEVFWREAASPLQVTRAQPARAFLCWNRCAKPAQEVLLT